MPSIIGSLIHSSRLVFLSLVAELGVQPSLHLFSAILIGSVKECYWIRMAEVLGMTGIRYDTATVSPSATGSSGEVQNKARQWRLTDLRRVSRVSLHDSTICVIISFGFWSWQIENYNGLTHAVKVEMKQKISTTVCALSRIKLEQQCCYTTRFKK